MTLLGPTQHRRLNELTGLVFLAGAIFLAVSLATFNPIDPSFDTATGATAVYNRMGRVGAAVSDLLLQPFGLGAFLAPAFLLLLAWKWIRSKPIEEPVARLIGGALLLASCCTAVSLLPRFPFPNDALLPGGIAGMLVKDLLISWFNLWGTILVTGLLVFVGLYLTTSFSLEAVGAFWESKSLPRLDLGALFHRRKEGAKDTAEVPKKTKAAKTQPAAVAQQAVAEPAAAAEPVAPPEEIPIRPLEDPVPPPEPPAWDDRPPFDTTSFSVPEPPKRHRIRYELPSTNLLNEPDPRNSYDTQELKDIAARIKSKFEEFNVLGNVVQINPGPVVTTFEFKPEAGIKYSRITNLTEDLCLGLQAESILIERIPGKPTVGIEVPNTHSEVISLRQILESDEFNKSESRLTIALGKDINGRMKVTRLESMPHLLIAGSTGSGKSVMMNSLIMSLLYKATPEEVRMIMVDPKRLEFGLYEGIPHLLTPVITDAKKATNALKNAVLEMERRLKLLASYGVRNMEQFNRKVRQMRSEPKSLFNNPDEPVPEELRPLPYVLIVIDELSDLMMLERAGVEESITRLAQMARAVGMHLVVATQRPSVDVITGLIKANFPARISFRVATRVDSRTVLDIMGAEHLLGKGDMLFLPPGTSRLMRVHGSFVTESEINKVVDFWKEQAEPEYENDFLEAPPSENGEDEAEADEGDRDSRYDEAVRVVVEMGKASTSILQRRLRLGYGRAARILDRMQKEGIIGPPDGSRPREVLRRPDWLDNPNLHDD